MKTRITQNIDGYDIIIGIGEAQINPIATIRKIQAEKIIITPQNRRELFKQFAIYLNTPNEIFITDKEAETIIHKMKTIKNEDILLDINLKEICDNRGKIVWRKISGKWMKRDISILGDDLKAGEILQNNLSESESLEITEQLESERISKLSQSEKEIEKQSMMDSIANQAVTMKLKLEIQNDLKALEKSKEWYNSEIEKINIKY